MYGALSIPRINGYIRIYRRMRIPPAPPIAKSGFLVSILFGGLFAEADIGDPFQPFG